jgi:hypothetical protein
MVVVRLPLEARVARAVDTTQEDFRVQLPKSA